MSIEVQVPEIGESVATVFISKWLKSPGDQVSKGEGLVELDSDKASMEVPSPEDGVLEEQLAAEGDEVDVGSVIARLGDGSGAAAGSADEEEAAEEEPADEEAADEEAADEEAAEEGAADEAAADEAAADEAAADEAAAGEEAEQEKAAEPEAAGEGEGPRAGPAARAAARERGIDLATVEGTGKGGRITREDVEKAAEGGQASEKKGAEKKAAEKKAAEKKGAGKKSVEKKAESAPSRGEAEGGKVERVPMSPLRRTISRRLVQVQNDAAILTTFNEIDMGAVMAMRKRYQDRFVDKYDIKLGFMSFFVKACVSALMEYPAVNAEVDGTDLVYKHYYNIGVAVSGPKGLVVPVVRDADQLSFAEVEEEIARLARKAGDNKLELSDFADGTFTISNGGIFGSMMSTPILNPPQVGILGMHNIVKRPMVVQNDAGEDEIAIRPMMYVALSYDHRIIDGREAVSFLKRVKELVEDPERILIEV